MADLTDLESSGVTRIVGADPAGTETFPAAVNSDYRLLVDANIDSGQLVPTITNKFRIVSNIGDITITTAGWTTMYTRAGTGLFFGFQASFNNSDVRVRLMIDGGQVFDLLLDDVRQFQFNDTTTTRTQMGGFLTTIGNVLDFSSKFAIPYGTSILIEMKAESGSRKNNNWIVFETQDS